MARSTGCIILCAPVGDSIYLTVICFSRYCYLLNDLTPQLLSDNCSTYEDLRDYLHRCGREAYLQKKVCFFSAIKSSPFPFALCIYYASIIVLFNVGFLVVPLSLSLCIA